MNIFGNAEMKSASSRGKSPGISALECKLINLANITAISSPSFSTSSVLLAPHSKCYILYLRGKPPHSASFSNCCSCHALDELTWAKWEVTAHKGIFKAQGSGKMDCAAELLNQEITGFSVWLSTWVSSGKRSVSIQQTSWVPYVTFSISIAPVCRQSDPQLV